MEGVANAMNAPQKKTSKTHRIKANETYVDMEEFDMDDEVDYGDEGDYMDDGEMEMDEEGDEEEFLDDEYDDSEEGDEEEYDDSEENVSIPASVTRYLSTSK